MAHWSAVSASNFISTILTRCSIVRKNYLEQGVIASFEPSRTKESSRKNHFPVALHDMVSYIRFMQNITRLQFNKFGLAENPIGLKVSMPWKNRTLLGDVVGCVYNDVRGVFVLTVRHFCGDDWPVSPVASAVEVIR